MLVNLFLKGWMIGFSVAMPVGPTSMLCIRHSLMRGTLYGLVAGLGVALADTFYGLLASLGMTFVSDLFSRHQIVCQLIGAFFLSYLGLSNLRSKPSLKEREEVPLSFLRVFLMTFFFTLTNPLTVLSFVGIYAALGVGLIENKCLCSLIMPIGIFIGSAIWWFILSFGTSLVGKKMNFKSAHFINRISGGILLAFGILVALLTCFEACRHIS